MSVSISELANSRSLKRRKWKRASGSGLGALIMGLLTSSCLAASDIEAAPPRFESSSKDERALRPPVASAKLSLAQGGSQARTFGVRKLTAEHTFDTRGFNTTNFTGSTPLPYEWNVWGFIDLLSADGGAAASRKDASEFFYEVDLKRKLLGNLGVVFEVDDAQGNNNVIGRAGAFYVAPWPLLADHDAKLFFKVFPLESDRRGWQASMAFSKRFPSIAEDRISIGGFVDLNFDGGNRHGTTTVSETQLRIELIEDLRLFFEFRLNEFLVEQSGVGIGLQAQF